MPIDLDKLSDRVNRMTEQREAASAPPAPEPSIWQRASEALDQAGAEATGYGEENVPAESWEEFGTGAVDKAEAFGNLISNTYRDVSEARQNMLNTQQELTASYTPDAVDEANSTGDYSLQDASVANMQEAGSTFAVSPFKESTREFISAYAEDNDSRLQRIAQNLRRSTANVEYFMNPAEKIAKARDIEEATGIPSSAILSDTDAYKNALEIYDFTQKQRNAVKDGPFDMQKVYDEYPELKSLAELSPQDAALALHDMKSVRSAHGIIDAFTKSLEYGNEKLEYDNLQYKIMQGTATENDKQRAEDLKKKLEHDVSLPSFFDDPLMYVASGVAGSAPEMGQSLVYMAHDAAVGALAGMAAGAAVGAVPGAGVGLVAGSIGNVFRGYVMRQAAMQGARVAAGAMGRYGMFRGMYAPEAGDRYAQNKEMTDEKGNPLLSEQAAKDYATVGGALNAGIEMADFGLVLKTMKGNPAAEQVVKSIVGRAQAESGARAALTDALTKQAGGMLKVTAAETGEEGLQQISDDLIHNDIEERTGDTSNGGVYSASKLAANAFVAMGQALPASLGFGVVSAGTGTVSGASGLARHIQKLTNEQTKFDQLARETMTGAVMAGRLQEAVKVSKLNQLAPDVQERILRDQLSGTKFETAYIDTESAMASESGREDIEKVAGKAGYSKEDIETAIAEKGTIAVPLEKYAQSEASPNLLNSVTFSNEAEPMAKMQAAAKEASEAYAKTMQKAAERQKRLTDIVTKELFPVDGEERQTAQAVLITDPQNPARGWRQLQKEMQAKRMEILQPAINALKAGMKQGVDIITDDSGRGTRVSNNDEWYRAFYANNKRAPREAELEDMARDMVTGAESAPKVLGWIPTSEEEQQAFAESQAELKEAEDTLFVLDRIKGRMTDMNGVEMEITEGMSPEAYGVYRNMLENLKAGPGMSVRAARVGALLFARHADIVAPKIAKATGKKFTAKDYYEKKFELDLNGKYKGDFNQSAYHGSPYDFEEFSTENIGSGEGAQAHGWGLYFAGEREVSEIYREKLSSGDVLRFYGDRYTMTNNGWVNDEGDYMPEDEPATLAMNAFNNTGGDAEKAIKKLQGEAASMDDTVTSEAEKKKNIVEAIKIIEDEGVEKASAGNIFEVDIPDDDVMLDEQKLFTNQPRNVQEKIKQMAEDIKSRDNVANIIKSTLRDDLSKMTGEDIYNIFLDVYKTPEKTSKELNAYGIEGITYEGGKDGRCFVVFDDKAISIIEKYNQGPLGSTSLLSDGRRAISLFENANESTFLHEMGHMFLMDLEDLSKDDLESAKELAAVEDWAEWKKGMSDEYADTPWAEEFKKMEQTIINAEEAGDVRTAENEKLKWKNERFARGFERYLREGKAPAKGLRAVFRKFRSFLVQLYQTILGDGSKPSREVEAVMARMIATDEEINEAAITDTYKDVEKAGGDKLLGESEKETRERWHDEAMAEARENLTKIVMQDYEKEKQNEVQHRLTAERQKKKDELMQNDKIYVARQAVEDSKDHSMALAFGYENVAEYEKENKEKPSLEEAVDAYMDEYARALDKEMLQQHMTPQAVREAIESSKYHKKLVAMEAAAYERKAMLIKKITSKAEKAMQGVAEKLDALPDHTDMVADKEDGRVKDVLQALNKLRFSARWSKKDFSSIDAMMKGATKEEIASALKEFQKESAKQQTGLKELERATEGKMKIFEALARESVRGKKLADALSVATYERNEKRAEKNALKMARVGKWDLAAQQKQSAAMSAAMAHEARKMIGETNALLDKAKKMLNTKVRVTKNERYWYRHLAYLLRIAPQDIAKPQDLMSLSNLVTMMKENHTLPDDYEPSMIMEKSQEQNFAGWRSLTYPELEEAVDILTILYTSGRDAYNMKTVSGKTIDDVMDEIVTDNSNYVGDMQVKHHYSTNDEGGMGSIAHLRFLSRMNAKNLAMHFKPEVMLRIIGEKAHRYIYGTYERAAEKEGEMRWEAIHQLKKILSAYTHKERQGWKKRQFDFNGDKKEFSKENIICMALNMGNDINFRRLYMSHNVDETTMREFVYKNMTKKDWQLVQKIWDLVGSYWKETVEVEETLNGVQLKGVEARPFQVIMPDGEVVKLRGGYYPIIYNPDKSQRAADLSANAELKSQMSGAAVLGSGRGFTKSRSEADISRPLLLELDGITAHLDAVAHNIAYRVAARDVYRLVNDARFVQHVTETLGTQYYSALHGWATDVWAILPADNGQTGKAINRAIGYLRRNAVMAIMGYRVWPVVENLSNIGPVMDKLGPVKAATAISHFYANRAESMKLLNRSVFMRNRINSMDRDIRSQPGLFNATSRPMEIIRDHAYTMMTVSDLMLSAPLWVQAYRDSFADKVREVAAENEENKNAVVKAQAEYDAARAAAIDIYTKRKAVRDEISLRNRGLRDNTSAYHGWSLEDLNAEDYNLTEQGKDASKKEWEADTRLQLAAETQLMTDDEIEKEAKKRSVMAADAVIRDTFGSGEVKDQAGIQRSRNELYKVATTFYSFFNTQFNAIVIQYYKGKANGWEHIGSWAPLARSIMCRLIVMSLIGSVLKMLTKTDGDDDKDKYRTVTGPDGKKQKEEIGWNERFMKVFAKNLLQTGTGSLAFLRDLAGYAINKYFDGTDYGRGINPFATSTAGFQQAAKAIDLFASMSQKNLEIEEKHAKEAERYAKMTKKQKKKWDEDAVYRKPDKKITYTDILKQAVDAGSSFTASYHGLSNTVVNSALTTMQYLNDDSNRYDPTVTNILWSAIFNKKPVERETPKKPPAPPKKNKRGNVK